MNKRPTTFDESWSVMFPLITPWTADGIWQYREAMGIRSDKAWALWLREMYGLGMLRASQRPGGPVIIAVYVN